MPKRDEMFLQKNYPFIDLFFTGYAILFHLEDGKTKNLRNADNKVYVWCFHTETRYLILALNGR